jgi:type II secretory pathway component PulK
MNVHCRDRRSFISERVSRSGAVLVAALVCLLIVISILGTMLRATLRTGRQLHVERDRRQAELLLQAGADRAARLLASNSQFRGDTWTLPAEAILDQGGGTVTTSLARESEELPWQLQVSAEYPLGRDFSIRRSRTFLVEAP